MGTVQASPVLLSTYGRREEIQLQHHATALVHVGSDIVIPVHFGGQGRAIQLPKLIRVVVFLAANHFYLIPLDRQTFILDFVNQPMLLSLVLPQLIIVLVVLTNGECHYFIIYYPRRVDILVALEAVALLSELIPLLRLRYGDATNIEVSFR